jgi:hypothetical protein
LLMPCIDNVGVAADVGTVPLLAVTTFMVMGKKEVVRGATGAAHDRGTDYLTSFACFAAGNCAER